MTHDCDIRANVEKFKCGVMSGEFLLKSVSVYFIIHLFIMSTSKAIFVAIINGKLDSALSGTAPHSLSLQCPGQRLAPR